MEKLRSEKLRADFSFPKYMQENSWGIHVCANACGACIRTRANAGKYFRGIISCMLAKFWREFIFVRIHVAPVFAPVRIQEKYWRIIYVLVSCRGVLFVTNQLENCAPPMFSQAYSHPQ